MPLITFDSPVARISGRLGQAPNTYTYNNGAPVIRAQVGPTNPDTTDQQAIRAIFSTVTKNWKNLSNLQRNAWTAFAQANNVTNRLGRPVGRNGLSAYVELATGHYIDTSALLSAAPVLPRPSGPTAVSIDNPQFGGAAVNVTVSHGYTTLTGLFLVVRATAAIQYESQTPKPTDYRLVKGVNTASIVPLTASGDSYAFTSTKYTYVSGDWLGVEVSIMNAEGWQSVAGRAFDLYSTA